MAHPDPNGEHCYDDDCDGPDNCDCECDDCLAAGDAEHDEEDRDEEE